MGRPTLHSKDTILDASRELALHEGARSVTIAAVAQASGAPKGSIYHRFESLDELLAQMWLRAVRRSQQAFLDAFDQRDPMTAAVDGALAIHDFAVREPGDARLLASLRRHDLINDAALHRLQPDLEQLNRPLQAAIRQLARRLYGRATRTNIERTTCAVVDLPMGAIRRHLIAGSALPPTLRPQLQAAVHAALHEAN